MALRVKDHETCPRQRSQQAGVGSPPLVFQSQALSQRGDCPPQAGLTRSFRLAGPARGVPSLNCSSASHVSIAVKAIMIFSKSLYCSGDIKLSRGSHIPSLYRAETSARMRKETALGSHSLGTKSKCSCHLRQQTVGVLKKSEPGARRCVPFTKRSLLMAHGQMSLRNQPGFLSRGLGLGPGNAHVADLQGSLLPHPSLR